MISLLDEFESILCVVLAADYSFVRYIWIIDCIYASSLLENLNNDLLSSLSRT